VIQISFAAVELADLHHEISRHLESLPAPIDSFLEDHVRDSKHYVISGFGSRLGFASIHGEGLITQFSLEPACQHFGQAAFQALRKLESVRAAFVPTCDEFYLSHAIDDYRQLTKQAYFFVALPKPRKVAEAEQCSLKLATAADEQIIRERSRDLFADVSERIARGELFVTCRAGASVGFGVLVPSQFQRDVASIGMFTLEPFRRTGVGAATIALLIEECCRRKLRAVAGCWYYNHASKRTLERAGMISKTRLLRVEY